MINQSRMQYNMSLIMPALSPGVKVDLEASKEAALHLN
jgi:hypothetical protein